ncbi:DUF4013 domain-containing protein [uncultured Methanobrevibacter sp.]|uniref:DUF4013 domain-containing protein n=1 Tax=uncultured Methanobrevibacter sp. TaxID=253161 RepID=UPI0025DB5695|nr:DUF4013 domain-containing protein [uncultured Methanobrevibacter sp.]
MNIGEIISDALSYPFQNMKALLIYAIIGVIGGIIGGASLVGIVASIGTTGVKGMLAAAGTVGFIVMIILFLLIEGYGLDIIKYGIEKRSDGPSVDFGRQIVNALKLIVVGIIYYIIPVILMYLLSLIFQGWLTATLSILIFIIFALANFMAKCRLAHYDSLGEAFAISEVIGDISRVGLGKLIATVIVIVIMIIIMCILIGFLSVIPIIGNIILGLGSVYIAFFYNRAVGLLYSDA